MAEDEWNGARDEEYPFTHGRYRSLPTEELRRRQDARYRTWDVVRKDDGKLYLITSEEDPVEWEHEGCFLEGIECDAEYRPIGCAFTTFVGLSVIDKVGHVSKDEVPQWEEDPVARSMPARDLPAYIRSKGYRPPLWMVWMDVENFLRNGELTGKLYEEVPPGQLREAIRRAVAHSEDQERITGSPYIPEWQVGLGLLPRSSKDGSEVFVWPQELDVLEDMVAEREGAPKDNGTRLYPSRYKSYAEYFSKLRRYERGYRESDPDLADAFETVIDLLKDANHKEWWSVVRYTGRKKIGPNGLTPQRCYYWPCSPEHPEYEGVIDDEEFTSYLYPCDPSRWEIVDDPTGMAARALGGEAETVDFWEMGDTELEQWAHERGLRAKRKGSYSMLPKEDPWGESERDRVEFACPQCGTQIAFDAWTKVNGRDDPEVAKGIVDGSFCEFTCPTCGYTAHLSHPCLYLDPIHRACVYSVQGDQMRQGVESLFESLEDDDGIDGPSGSMRRIVFSREELADKVAALSTGLDDRALELLKLGIAGQAMLDNKVDPQCEYMVLFKGTDLDNLVFEIDDETGASLIASIPRSAYELYARRLRNSTASNMQSFYVNREWAETVVDIVDKEAR
ncbi:CpXC domain-containing protein [Parafannyhessea umbonata]|uniref:CpXC domain-containing protein n=2 Tax=Parafannyhessea umbonata TaxID=604330 RepID=UPI0026EF6043|nr:CpXC domain-containing protein [Parafannyhessea umbonata]MDD7198620.1 CpXC domain-containing protein [Parafannyhessea umbonata]MDY4418820.1 CpXC domain-containing protein [Parafannyhessea umbonata]